MYQAVFSRFDRAIIHFDGMLKTIHNKLGVAISQTTNHNDDWMPQDVRDETISMLRVNHAGEICAQALYYGQALVCRSNTQYLSLLASAEEEEAHLNWCKQRLTELGGKTSKLDFFWYTGAIAIGILVASRGDTHSLGFVAETEHQVTAHLDGHLQRIHPQDVRTKSILQQMRADEIKHANSAIAAGGKELAPSTKFLMRCAAKVMTTVAARW